MIVLKLKCKKYGKEFGVNKEFERYGWAKLCPDCREVTTTNTTNFNTDADSEFLGEHNNITIGE